MRSLLHFVIVDAGLTEVEVSSELSDLFSTSYASLYPHLKSYISIAIHDVANQVLSGFDTKLQDYAIGSFTKQNVEVMTRSYIKRVKKDSLYTKEKGRIDAGLLIWATGNKSTALVDSLPVKKTLRNLRILTDSFLRVYTLLGTFWWACQKAKYLAKVLNGSVDEEFQYKQTAIVAYSGQNNGVVSGKKDYSGPQAWITWRTSMSKEFTRGAMAINRIVLSDALTVQGLITIILGAISVYAVLRCVYLLYFHPLSKLPGPRIAATSNVWYAYHWLSERYPWAIENALRNYGDVVRIAPNELVFVTPQASV
ncbi:hypothetical protein BKA61DRAFT_741584, partial [Leptodontidium sp. MPI-SDFR-AT-0119]